MNSYIGTLVLLATIDYMPTKAAGIRFMYFFNCECISSRLFFR